MDDYIEQSNNIKYSRRKHVVTFPEANPIRLHRNRYDDYYRLIGKLKIKRDSLLDVGCGDGRLLFVLRNLFNKLVGTEVSKVAAEIATDVFQEIEHVDIHMTALNENNINDYSGYSVVTCCAVLEHVIDPFHLLSLIHKSLMPNGYALFTVPNIGYIKHRFRLMFGKIPLTGVDSFNLEKWKEIGWDGGHLHYFTKNTFFQLLEFSGFKPIACVSDGKFSFLRGINVSVLGGNLTVLVRKN